MRATGGNPSGCSDFKIRLGNPYRPRDGQFRERLFRSDHVYLVYHQTKTVAHIDQRSVDRVSCAGCEHQTHGVFFSANRQGMNFERWLVGGNGWADLKHMRAQHLSAVSEVIGVIFHERSATVQTVAHDFHGPHQSSGLPIALGAEAVAVAHEALHSDTGKLLQAV